MIACVQRFSTYRLPRLGTEMVWQAGFLESRWMILNFFILLSSLFSQQLLGGKRWIIFHLALQFSKSLYMRTVCCYICLSLYWLLEHIISFVDQTFSWYPTDGAGVKVWGRNWGVYEVKLYGRPTKSYGCVDSPVVGHQLRAPWTRVQLPV